MVRYWISLISVSFVMLGTLYMGNVAFSMESVDSSESIDNVESLGTEPVETEEVKPGQDFSPTVVPTGRIQGIWEHVIAGTKDGKGTGKLKLDPDGKEEQGSQFYPRRLFLGAKGKVLPTVGYLLLAQMQGTTASMLRAFITVDLLDQYLKARMGYMTVPLEKESLTSSKLLFVNGADIWGGSPGAAVMGLMLFGSAVNSQLHYHFWVGNVNRQYSSLNNLFDKGFGKWYQIGARIQFDWFRKWKHGQEWLQSKDMNGTIGVSFRYIPAFEESSLKNALVQHKIGVNIDLAFTVSLFYIQGGFVLDTASVSKEALTKANATGDARSHNLYMGYFVDVAVTVANWFVPAVRFQGRGARIAGGINPGSAAVPAKTTGPASPTDPHTHEVDPAKAAVPSSASLGSLEKSEESKMDLLVVLNFYPWSGGHRFKIQPEFGITLQHLDGKGDSILKNSENKDYLPMYVRVGIMLNF